MEGVHQHYKNSSKNFLLDGQQVCLVKLIVELWHLIEKVKQHQISLNLCIGGEEARRQSFEQFFWSLNHRKLNKLIPFNLQLWKEVKVISLKNNRMQFLLKPEISQYLKQQIEVGLYNVAFGVSESPNYGENTPS